MNILVVLENYHPNIGGVETLFKSVCEGLVRLGHKVRVVTSGREDSEAFECINGVDIQRITIHSRYLFTLFCLLPLWRLRSQYDLILTTSYNAAFPAWIAAYVHRKNHSGFSRNLGTPVVSFAVFRMDTENGPLPV